MKKEPLEAAVLKHVLLVLLLALTISGCSTITYKEPKSGSVARVRFVSDLEGVTVVRGYSSTECDGEHEMMRLRNGFFINSDPRRLGIPLCDYHKNAAQEFFISAGVPQIYMFDATLYKNSSIYQCGVVVQQKFEEGKDYEVSYKWNNFNCNVEVSEIKANDSGRAEKVMLQKRDNRLNQSCLTAFKKKRFW